ncbi:ankyrin repeat containing protein [Colletotrichum musicola]|uniref:Ankyrin repeat containing protein n=1 Tax=Colletotrichum musicola TaxID=2175873 RepID=A0A8H6N0A4_9PEZI|nr:ankyrin repeat containing protein [Colletotrichum musicola]
MVETNRIAYLLGEVGLSPPRPIQALVRLSTAVDCGESSAESVRAARRLLVEQRISEPGYQLPEKQLRHFFRTKKRKQAAVNGTSWVFSKHEIAKAFNSLICSAPLPPAETAQALLSFAAGTPLSDLWGRLSRRFDWKNIRRSASFLGPTPSRIAWLDIAVAHNNSHYVHLLCQAQIGKDAMDRALGIALSRNSVAIVALLLSFGAVASEFQDLVREQISRNNIALVKLLLSAHPSSMSIDAWRHCLTPAVSQDELSEILIQCLAHRPELACVSMLLEALASQSLQGTAIILAYAGPANDFTAISKKACELAFLVESHNKRLKFITILSHAGLVGDGQAARRQLMAEVKARNLAVVRVLVAAGVFADDSFQPLHNSLLWAVAHLDFEMLEVLKMANATTSLSNWLRHVPATTSEGDALRLLAICSFQGSLAGEPLDWHLVRAVKRREKKLIGTLVQLGASIDYDQASAVQEALQAGDLDTLDVLLQCPSSPERLSKAIPVAMRLDSKHDRLRALKSLLRKGVQRQDLAEPLRTVVSEDAGVDVKVNMELIHLLLRHKATVDSGDRSTNPILVATRKGNLPVLQMLCGAPVGSYTLSEAIPIAYRMIKIHKTGFASCMIRFLLEKGAQGSPVDLTLLAAVRDSEVAIVRLLLARGADANNDGGACFLHAVEESNVEMLNVLCTGRKPTKDITQALLRTAVDPKFCRLPILEVLLSSIPSATTTIDNLRDVLVAKDNPNINAIVCCFLRHGVDVDTGEGFLLCLAVEAGDAKLLAEVLSHDPTTRSLRRAFKTCTEVQPRGLRLDMMKSLLETAGHTEIGQSDQLLQETKAAIAGHSQGLKLLIRHKPAGDFEGEYLRVAAASGSLQVLNMLLSLETTSAVLKRACLAAASSTLSGMKKKEVIDRLLDFRRPSDEDISEMLATAISGGSDFSPLAEILLSRGARITFEILQDAAQKSLQTFAALVAKTDDETVLRKTFSSVRNAPLSSERKFWVCRRLLMNMTMSSDELSQALLDVISAGGLENLSLPELFLEHGADVRFLNCEAFTIAFRSVSPDLVNLLTQHIVDDGTASRVFELAQKTSALSAEMRRELYLRLLRRGNGISTASKYSALMNNLQSQQRDAALVGLLLASGVDPNVDDARCFVVAAEAGAEPEFRALSKKATFPTVAKALIEALGTETEVVKWLRICLVRRPTRAIVGEGDLILKCLEKFPRGTSLLRLFLDNGASVSTTTRCQLGPGLDAEDVTILIWALMSQMPRISTEAILILIKQRPREVLPLYVSPQAKLSAAFACVLDPSRAVVLKVLLKLELDGGDVTKHIMPGQDFGNLIRSRHNLDCPPELPDLKLDVACLMSGNFKAFERVVSQSRDIQTEGTLHIAAFLGLPDVVGWLLQQNEKAADETSEEFDFLIPLAVTCRAKSQPHCVFANGTWAQRHMKTMQLLAAKTDPDWKSYNRKSVLHIALENGPEVTKLMVEALGVRNDPLRDERYLFEDKTGVFYSPDQYVKRILKLELGLEPADEKALLQALALGRMTPRYYKDVLPGQGKQPYGYVGLPPELAKKWEAHEKEQNLSVVVYEQVT